MKKQLLKQHIALGGPIGVGKTTWLNNHKEEFKDFVKVKELFDNKNKNVQKTIKNSYKKKVSLNDQLLLCDYIWEQYEKTKYCNKVIYDRGILDPYIFGIIYFIYHKDDISAQALHQELFRKLGKIDKNYTYYIFVCKLEENLRRIKERNRNFEKDKKFIKYLCKNFSHLLADYCELFHIKYKLINTTERIK